VIVEERACGLAESVWAGGGLCLSCWEWGLIAAQPWLPPLISWKWTMSGHVCACEFAASLSTWKGTPLLWKQCLKLTYETTALKRAGPWDLKGLSIVIVFILVLILDKVVSHNNKGVWLILLLPCLESYDWHILLCPSQKKDGLIMPLDLVTSQHNCW